MPTPARGRSGQPRVRGVTAAVALALAVIALAGAPDVAARRSWYLLDTGGGIFLALIAVIGLASAAASPAYLRHAGRGFFSARRSRAAYYAAFNLFWATLLAVPLDRQPRGRMAADRGDDRGLGAAGRVQRQAQRARGGLEVRRPDDARADRDPARDRRPVRRRRDVGLARRARLAVARRRGPRAAARDDPDRVRADHRRPGREDRLGAGPQLAARRAQRGAAADQRAALGGAAADRAAGRLAHRARARAGARRGRRAGAPRRVRARLARGRRPVPVAAAAAGSGCSPTRASSTWACSRSGSASGRRSRSPGS